MLIFLNRDGRGEAERGVPISQTLLGIGQVVMADALRRVRKTHLAEALQRAIQRRPDGPAMMEAGNMQTNSSRECKKHLGSCVWKGKEGKGVLLP